jgi:hypothetical protein
MNIKEDKLRQMLALLTKKQIVAFISQLSTSDKEMHRLIIKKWTKEENRYHNGTAPH